MKGRRTGTRPVVDLVEFARTGGELSGSAPPDGFPRLHELLAGDAGTIDWRVTGERRPRPEGGSDAYLALALRGSVMVECIRCLQGVEVPLEEDRLFRVTATESQAERLDAETDECDALVADPRFDVLGLVEDEAILALPIAPRHAQCGLPAGAAQVVADDAGAAAERPNPFAVLASLKRPGGGEKDS